MVKDCKSAIAELEPVGAFSRDQAQIVLDLENRLYQDSFLLPDKCTALLEVLDALLSGVDKAVCISRTMPDGLSIYNSRNRVPGQPLIPDFLDWNRPPAMNDDAPDLQDLLAARLGQSDWSESTMIPLTAGDVCRGMLLVKENGGKPDASRIGLLRQIARIFTRAMLSRSINESPTGELDGADQKDGDDTSPGSHIETDRKSRIMLHESQITQRLEYEKSLITCSRVLLASGNEDDNLTVALEQLLKASGAKRIVLARSNTDGQSVILTHAITQGKDRLIRSRLRDKKIYCDEMFMGCIRSLTEGEVSVGCIGPDNANSMTLKKMGMSDYLLTPISIMGQWTGFIGYSMNEKTIPWTEHDIEMLKAGAEMFGIYFEREFMGQKIRKSEETMRAMINSSPFSAILIDRNSIVLDLNENAMNLLDLTRDMIVGSRLAELVDAAFIPQIESLFKDIMQNRSLLSFEYDAEQRFFNLSGVPIFGSQKDKIERVAVYIHDITQQKISDHEISHKIKMESIGQLAAGIAHEINSPMQYISNYSLFLEESFKELDVLLENLDQWEESCSKAGETCPMSSKFHELKEEMDLEFLRKEIPSAIEHTNKGIAMVTKIVSSMKTFSHPDSKDMTAVDLNNSIDSTITVSRNEWKYVAEIVTDFDESLPVVTCFVSEINQAILNIIVNAAHAIGDSASGESAEKGLIGITTLHDNGWAEIRITDTGCGMTPNIIKKIFDPFFTTKEVGKGTGQGLSISHGVIVTKHGGSIDVESEAGHGTTFVIRIPVKPGELADTKSDPGPETSIS